MRHGFVKVAAATPDIRVADVAYNQEQICRLIDETASEGAKIVVFPELALTGYTCGDLLEISLPRTCSLRRPERRSARWRRPQKKRMRSFSWECPWR